MQNVTSSAHISQPMPLESSTALGWELIPTVQSCAPLLGDGPPGAPHRLSQGTGIIPHFGKPLRLVSNKGPNKRREIHVDMLGGRFPE